MDDERQIDQSEAYRQNDARQREAEDRYQAAQKKGSLEGERAALQALDVQALQNRLARVEGRLNRLEDEVTALRHERQDKPV
jgi:hypothetical protein